MIVSDEAKREAEHIANRVAGIGAMGALGIPSAAGERPSEFTGRVVDVLAAAIELHDSAVGRNNRGQWEYVEASEEQMQALSRALSALREDTDG